MMLVLTLSLLIGLALGLLGGGGSILTVPILVYGLGLEAKHAIATSLLVVAVTSSAALVGHARRGLVDFRTGFLFGAAGMVGAFLGGRLASLVSGSILLLGFAAMMLATAIAMLRSREDLEGVTASDRPAVKLSLVSVVFHGSIVGVLTGLIGAGGGFLIVPALVLLGGMPMRAAVATSLLVAPLLGIPNATAERRGTCPDVLPLFSQHLEGDVSADVCAQMEQHLEGCGRCRGACDSLKQTLALCRTTGAAEGVPPAVQANVRMALQTFLASRGYSADHSDRE